MKTCQYKLYHLYKSKQQHHHGGRAVNWLIMITLEYQNIRTGRPAITSGTPPTGKIPSSPHDKESQDEFMLRKSAINVEQLKLGYGTSNYVYVVFQETLHCPQASNGVNLQKFTTRNIRDKYRSINFDEYGSCAVLCCVVQPGPGKQGKTRIFQR